MNMPQKFSQIFKGDCLCVYWVDKNYWVRCSYQQAIPAPLIQCLFHPRVTAVAPQRPGHSAKSAGGRLLVNMHIYPDPTKTEWADYAAVQAYCGEPVWKQAHRQLVREHSAMAVSACWATVDWCWHEERNKCVWANFHLKKQKKPNNWRWGMNGRTFSQNPRNWGKSQQ